VSLDWHAWPNASPWHATANAIRVAGGQVTVEVYNRGRLPANGVNVRVWWASWGGPGSGPLPKSQDAAWTLLGSDGPKNVPPWPGGAPPWPAGTQFAVNGPPGPGPCLILAEATCADDRANTDAATEFPCALSPTSIVDLVAGDNNLALRPHP